MRTQLKPIFDNSDINNVKRSDGKDGYIFDKKTFIDQITLLDDLLDMTNVTIHSLQSAKGLDSELQYRKAAREQLVFEKGQVLKTWIRDGIYSVMAHKLGEKQGSNARELKRKFAQEYIFARRDRKFNARNYLGSLHRRLRGADTFNGPVGIDIDAEPMKHIGADSLRESITLTRNLGEDLLWQGQDYESARMLMADHDTYTCKDCGERYKDTFESVGNITTAIVDARLEEFDRKL